MNKLYTIRPLKWIRSNSPEAIYWSAWWSSNCIGNYSIERYREHRFSKWGEWQLNFEDRGAGSFKESLGSYIDLITAKKIAMKHFETKLDKILKRRFVNSNLV